MVRKYPWGKWFKQDRVVIYYGTDYTCSQSTMVQVIRNNASMRDLRVRITDMGDCIKFEVKRDEEARSRDNADQQTVPNVRDGVYDAGSTTPTAGV